MPLDAARMAIANRAVQEIGTPFRLFGRTSQVALDCVGLALVALGPELAPGRARSRYHLKGEVAGDVQKIMADTALIELDRGLQPEPGDLALVIPSPAQLHFMVCVPTGWVHADAGLGRVVTRPGPLPWQLCCLWRLSRN